MPHLSRLDYRAHGKNLYTVAYHRVGRTEYPMLESQERPLTAHEARPFRVPSLAVPRPATLPAAKSELRP